MLIVNYRLAPQNTFPAPLVDALLAYLSLLYPPDKSHYRAVSASDIVLAGDSAGADLCLSMIQVILSTRRKQNTDRPLLKFRDREVELPMPAGLTLLSTAPDLSGSLPGWAANCNTDILEDEQPCLQRDYPSCPLWPSDPPRANLYCAVSLLDHPLVSPITARDWRGSPPIFMFNGSGERSNDGARFLAHNIASHRVSLVWEEYEAMPHLWPFLFHKWILTQRCWESWARACKLLVESQTQETTARMVRVPDARVTEIDLRELTSMTMDEVRGYLKAFQRRQQPFLGNRSGRPSL